MGEVIFNKTASLAIKPLRPSPRIGAGELPANAHSFLCGEGFFHAYIYLAAELVPLFRPNSPAASDGAK
jgi:hypothetical protein